MASPLSPRSTPPPPPSPSPASSTPSKNRKRSSSLIPSSNRSSPNRIHTPIRNSSPANRSPSFANPRSLIKSLPPASPTLQNKHSKIDDSLRTFKLLQALRNADSQSILAFLSPDSPPNNSSLSQSDPPSPLITPLHLAVRCAKYHVVQLVVLNSPPSYITAQDPSGQTPLHIACALGRSDVISLLLAHPLVDDSIRDNQSRTCLEVCKSAELARLVQASRTQLSASFQALLSAYIASPQSALVSQSLIGDTNLVTSPADVIPPSTASNNHDSAADQLYKLISRPRARSLDLNFKEEQSGTTLLHEAARRKDITLIKLAISRGADVLARDRKGKMPIDVALDEKVKTVLRQAASSEGRALQAISESKSSNTDPPSTFSSIPNPAVGALSGSVTQPTLKGYLSKWTNMARGYSTRWLVLEKGFLSYYRDQKDEGKTLRGSIAMSVAIVAGPDVTKDKLRFEVSSKLGNSYPRFYLKGAHPLEVMRWVDALKQAIEVANQLATMSNSTPGTLQRKASTASIPNRRSFVSRHLRTARLPSWQPKGPSGDARQRGATNDPDSPQGSMFAHSTTDDDDSFGREKVQVPYEGEMELLVQGLRTHIEMTNQLIDSVTVSAGPATNGSQRQADVKQALKRSMDEFGSILDDYLAKAVKRERFHIRRYEEELLAKKLWEENMQALVTSQAEMEQQLQSVARDSSRRKKQLRTLRAGMAGFEAMERASDSQLGAERLEDSQLQASGMPAGAAADGPSRAVSPTSARAPAGHAHFEDLSSSDADSNEEDDEFFEVIETGLIPIEPLAVTKPMASEYKFSEFEISCLREGYENKRTTLPITADDRPSVSLWAILKNSIGKDLTKISFPVSFNEPVSMLQRMAEDMQFSQCLDAAAEQSDSLMRLAYVAGFAMSSYSTTVDRLAKPFNPLLGETFEYVDVEKEYRYLSEQISHHPPTSACYAESPRWTYSGETDAKNRFTGKSFEIKPSGVAHATLNIPKTFPGTEGYPAAKRNLGRVEEHYSWKKVTTVVSNFILGSPSIDHYGDMEITNHRTGERCVLTFKPRGWRGKDACEVKGSIYERDGRLAWEMAGKWTTQLIARRAGSAPGELGPDEPVVAKGREYQLLWKNEERLEKLPFNLTKFAVTLNEMNDALKTWLPPTDSRLRPDQHAFERGAWEKANELKTALEDYQRATKRRREVGEVEPHQPRWFRPVDDPDSGERTWEAIRVSPRGGRLSVREEEEGGEEELVEKDEGEDGTGEVAYWEERKRVGVKRKKGEPVEWVDVDHIFGEFELIEG